MKKSSRIKGLVIAVAMSALLAVFAFGCSSSSSSSDTSSDSADYETLYAAHYESVQNGEGIASYHVALGYTCEDCHGDNLVEQIEALATLDLDSDDESDEESEDTDDSTSTEPALVSTYYTDTATCLSSGCHDSWESLAEETSDLGDYNPHDSIHGTIENCNECHKGHGEQVDICGECHDNGGQTMLY